MRALADGGVLSVTLWNKEEPPKSVLKLYATMVEAARAFDGESVARSFFVASSYQSTATVLYKRGGFTADEIAKLEAHTGAMSFDEIYAPGFRFDAGQTDKILKEYREGIFGSGPTAARDASNPADASTAAPAEGDAEAGGPADTAEPIPATTMGQLAWHYLIDGGWSEVAANYVFDTRALTNDRPYFAGYVRPADLPRITDRLDLFQDEWGYLLIWATLGIASCGALLLVLFPVAFGWRTFFSDQPGKLMTVLYFGCLGLGYIMVEVGLIAKFTYILGNPTISAGILITAMLVSSGLGSLASSRLILRASRLAPVILVGIGALLLAYGGLLDHVEGAVGALPYAGRLVACFALISPLAFLMGFPMPTAMTWLGRLGKDEMFIWAWGINGCFSVIGSAAVPIIATSFGLSAVLEASAGAYLLAALAFGHVLKERAVVAQRAV